MPFAASRAAHSCLLQGGEVPSLSFLSRIALSSANNDRHMCREGKQRTSSNPTDAAAVRAGNHSQLWEVPEARKLEAAERSGHDADCSGGVADSTDRLRFHRTRTETPTATARRTNSTRGLFVQLAGRKTKGNENRPAKKQKIPKPRTHIKTIVGHFGLQPVKGNTSIWRTAAGSCLIQ